MFRPCKALPPRHAPARLAEPDGFQSDPGVCVQESRSPDVGTPLRPKAPMCKFQSSMQASELDVQSDPGRPTFPQHITERGSQSEIGGNRFSPKFPPVHLQTPEFMAEWYSKFKPEYFGLNDWCKAAQELPPAGPHPWPSKAAGLQAAERFLDKRGLRAPDPRPPPAKALSRIVPPAPAPAYASSAARSDPGAVANAAAYALSSAQSDAGAVANVKSHQQPPAGRGNPKPPAGPPPAGPCTGNPKPPAGPPPASAKRLAPPPPLKAKPSAPLKAKPSEPPKAKPSALHPATPTSPEPEFPKPSRVLGAISHSKAAGVLMATVSSRYCHGRFHT